MTRCVLNLGLNKLNRHNTNFKKIGPVLICPTEFSTSFLLQVIMGDRASAERACKDQNPIIDGRKANVNLAILGAKPRGNVQTGECLFYWRVRTFLLPAYWNIKEAWSLRPPGGKGQGFPLISIILAWRMHICCVLFVFVYIRVTCLQLQKCCNVV